MPSRSQLAFASKMQGHESKREFHESGVRFHDGLRAASALTLRDIASVPRRQGSLSRGGERSTAIGRAGHLFREPADDFDVRLNVELVIAIPRSISPPMLTL